MIINMEIINNIVHYWTVKRLFVIKKMLLMKDKWAEKIFRLS